MEFFVVFSWSQLSLGRSSSEMWEWDLWKFYYENEWSGKWIRMKNHFKNSSLRISLQAQAENTFNFNSTIFLDGKLHYGFGDGGFSSNIVCVRECTWRKNFLEGDETTTMWKLKWKLLSTFSLSLLSKVDIYGRVEEGDNLTCTWLCVQQQLRSCPQHHNLSCWWNERECRSNFQEWIYSR